MSGAPLNRIAGRRISAHPRGLPLSSDTSREAAVSSHRDRFGGGVARTTAHAPRSARARALAGRGGSQHDVLDHCSSSAAVSDARNREQPSEAMPSRPRRVSCPGLTSMASAKSEAVKREMRELMDDYFNEEHRGAPQRSAGRRTENDIDGNSTPRAHGEYGVVATDSGHTRLCSSPYYKKRRQTPLPVAPPLLHAWSRGPTDPAGSIVDVSDCNLLCMDILSSTTRDAHTRCVVGSADHGLVVLDVVTKQKVKTLYSKMCGHTEWVTSCAFVPTTEQVISGGMDSKVCLWSNVSTAHGAPVQCVDLLGHTGSVSMVDVSSSGSLACSSSYDRTIRLWDIGTSAGQSLGSRGGNRQDSIKNVRSSREVGCLSGHRAAVMQFMWSEQHLLSGDRGGTVKLWDVSTTQCLRTVAAKRGQISALGHLYAAEPLGHVIMMGDQGGVLTVLDAREGSRSAVAQPTVHPGAALSNICVLLDGSYIVTSGADRRLCVLEPRKNFAELCVWTDHVDYIYSLESMGQLVLSGGGNGWLLVHDVLHINGANDDGAGKPCCCYGLGAHEAAVRKICVDSTNLITAGDDGMVNIFEYA